MKSDIRRRIAAMPAWLMWTVMSLALPPVAGFLFWYVRWWLRLFDVWPSIEFLPRT